MKVISQLLYDLPASESYKVIFMRRDLDEIIASQETMLIRRGMSVPDASQIKSAFGTHLDRLFTWLPRQPFVELLEVNYNDLVTGPARSVEQIVAFLPLPVDAERMRSAIVPSLYRNRETSDSRSALPEKPVRPRL